MLCTTLLNVPSTSHNSNEANKSYHFHSRHCWLMCTQHSHSIVSLCCAGEAEDLNCEGSNRWGGGNLFFTPLNVLHTRVCSHQPYMACSAFHVSLFWCSQGLTFASAMSSNQRVVATFCDSRSRTLLCPFDQSSRYSGSSINHRMPNDKHARRDRAYYAEALR